MYRSDLPFLMGSSALMKARAAAGGYALPGGSIPFFYRRDESQQMATLRASLRASSAYSTVGIRTLSCMSPRNLTLERLAPSVETLPSPDEQVSAIDALFSESGKLYPDQNAHVLAKLVQDLTMPEGVVIADRAMSRVGQRILQAGLKMAPDLLSESMVSDSTALDMLKIHMNALIEHPDFQFSKGVNALMEDVGLMEPVTEEKFRNWDDTPECLANWIRNEIDGVMGRQIGPEDLSLLLDHTVTLPDDLRGRTLAHLVNTFTNAMQDVSNEQAILEIGSLIDELPLKIRLTPLEAYYNQLNLLRFEVSRAFFPMIHRSVSRIPEVQDFRFNRSRRDLTVSLQDMGHALEEVNFNPGETLRDAKQRFLQHGAPPPPDVNLTQLVGYDEGDEPQEGEEWPAEE